MMRDRILLAAGLVLVLALSNWAIAGRERLRSSGRTILLELAPVDPRSLMQGDYMRLSYKIETDLAGGPNSEPDSEQNADRRIVVALDEHQVATLVRGASAPAAPNHALLRYRRRNGSLRIGTDAYFFEEGTADLYSGARYGEFRVDANGDALLIALRDAKFKLLGK